MTTASTTPLPAPAAAGTAGAAVDVSSTDAARLHVRGSSLLLGGRLLSVGINFAAQVLIVRYLSKTDYGLFAYGLAFVTMGQNISALGLDKAVSRFLPMYEEDGAYDKILGTLLLGAATIASLGLAVVLVVLGLHGVLGDAVGGGDEAFAVLLILILLAPIQALDALLMGTFAVFSRPGAIFFRKYLLGPGLKLVAVVLVIASGTGVRELAGGYVAAGALGVALYIYLLIRTLQTTGMAARMRRGTPSLPWRELYGFALPLLAVDLLLVIINTVTVVMLGAFGSAADVADYRVVQRAAMLNLLVMATFTLLFTPMAARLFARRDREGMQDLYWRSAGWIAVCSFPMFALTFATAHQLTVLLFGERYASSAPVLALLSVGYYLSAALGFNGLTLRVFGLVRYTVVISLVAGALNIVLNLALIPAHGALGAGIATCATFVMHTVLRQAGLRRGTGVTVFARDHARVYAVLVAATAVLATTIWVLGPPTVVAFSLVAVVSAAVLLLTRDELRLADTFPELRRVPLLRRLVT